MTIETSQIAARKLRPPTKRHGGKAYLARRIIALFPPHRRYVEPFVGAGSVLLNKTEADHEIAGDLDADIINLWKVIRDQIDGLMNWLRDKEYTEEEFLWSKDRTHHPVPLIRAVHYLVTHRFSRGGMGKTFAWSERLRGGQPGDVNAWNTIRDELPSIAARAANVDFCCLPAATLVAAHDSPDTLTYCDPPYCPETRTVKKVYDHEMTREQHGDLLDLIRSCKGKVAISGYRCGLYDDALSGWSRVDFDMPNHSGQGKAKQRRTECLWMNYGVGAIR